MSEGRGSHPPAWAAKYIGLPYMAPGRSSQGLNCWGLVRMVLEEQAGIVLPSYRGTRDTEAEFRRAIIGSDWMKAMPPQAFDVMLMVTPTGPCRAAPMHVGVMVTPRIVLHVDEGMTSCMVSAAHPTVMGRFHGYYRHISRA